MSTSRSHKRRVTVHTFLNHSEQRYVSSHELSGFDLVLSNLNGYDLSQVLDFFIQMRGPFVDSGLVNVFTLVLDGVTYDYLAFSDDAFEAVETTPNLWNVTLKCSQMRRS